MARYIDKDFALSKMGDSFDYQELLNIPSIEIVRCKDCKFYGFFGRVKICKLWNGDPYEAAEPEENDFCSFAERRDDAEIH